jgi:hypothetical protein
MAIMQNWDIHKVKFCGCAHSLPYPLPGNVPVRTEAKQPRTTGTRPANRGKTDQEPGP